MFIFFSFSGEGRSPLSSLLHVCDGNGGGRPGAHLSVVPRDEYPRVFRLGGETKMRLNFYFVSFMLESPMVPLHDKFA